MVEPEELSILDENFKRIIEPGSYRLMVGNSSESTEDGPIGSWAPTLKKDVNVKN